MNEASIGSLSIGKRAKNVLASLGASDMTPEAFAAAFSEKDLLMTKGLGRQTLKEIVRALAPFGVQLVVRVAKCHACNAENVDLMRDGRLYFHNLGGNYIASYCQNRFPGPMMSAVRARRLLPCPFCGSSQIRFAPESSLREWRKRIECTRCSAAKELLVDQDLSLANAWNMRGGKIDPKFFWSEFDLRKDVRDVLQKVFQLDENIVLDVGFLDEDLARRFGDGALVRFSKEMRIAFGFEPNAQQVLYLHTANDWIDFISKGGFTPHPRP